MSLFAKIRQVYDRLRERIEASAGRMRQEREHLSAQADEKERQIAVERNSRAAGPVILSFSRMSNKGITKKGARERAPVRPSGSDNAGSADTETAPAQFASNSFLRWPSDTTPMSLRSSLVSWLSNSILMSLARNISAYSARPIPRSQPSMSMFCLPAGQRSFRETVEVAAPTVISKRFLEPNLE